jgi:hypothetical protein
MTWTWFPGEICGQSRTHPSVWFPMKSVGAEVIYISFSTSHWLGSSRTTWFDTGQQNELWQTCKAIRQEIVKSWWSPRIFLPQVANLRTTGPGYRQRNGLPNLFLLRILKPPCNQPLTPSTTSRSCPAQTGSCPCHRCSQAWRSWYWHSLCLVLPSNPHRDMGRNLSLLCHKAKK